MTILKLALELAEYGIHTDAAYEGDDTQDGDVAIGPMVHVQVPTFGGYPRVIADTLHEHMRCYPPRTTVEELAVDIRHALSEVPSLALVSCSIH